MPGKECIQNNGERTATWKTKMMWKDNIGMKCREIVYQYGRWFKLAQDPVQWGALVLTLWHIDPFPSSDSVNSGRC
jgi:hypothetical protein